MLKLDETTSYESTQDSRSLSVTFAIQRDGASTSGSGQQISVGQGRANGGPWTEPTMAMPGYVQLSRSETEQLHEASRLLWEEWDRRYGPTGNG